MSELRITSVRKMPPSYKRQPRPTVAVAGRSNVGKSTLINTLLGQKIAKTSKTPGRTRGVHRYLLNEQFDLVDLPGYGFAKVGEELRLSWRRMVSDFLEGHGNLRCLLVLVDARRGLAELDREMVQWALDEGVDCAVALTKTDKLKHMHLTRVQRETRKELDDAIPMFSVSAVKGHGMKELKRAMKDWYEQDAFKPT